ncbi:MAG TPA: shikimate dehydrogenase [Burkholderiales bacterium]
MSETGLSVKLDLLDRVDAPKFLVGLIGDGIQESLSPLLHEAEGAQQGLRLHYHLVDLADEPDGPAALPALLKAAARLKFRGLNITYPCKQAVIPLLDGLSEDAAAIGAVNTVVIEEGRFVGHNTDWSGFARSFEHALPDVPLERVALVGAGGAGAAVAHAIFKLGARRLTIVDADQVRAGALAQSLAKRFPNAWVEIVMNASEAVREAQGLIQATPMGMAKNPGMPIEESALTHRPWVAEVVYFPIETELLKAARRHGCQVVDGGGMAVGQAIGAFELFTGREADAARMDAHFRRLLENKAKATPSAP